MALTLAEYNRFCRSLPATTHVVQWGGAHVWKIGAKVFAIGGWNNDHEQLFVTFKCSPMSYDMLKDVPGCRPAPYLASRGMKWIQRTSAEKLSDTGLRDYLRASYQLVIEGLPKRIRQELEPVSSTREAKPRIDAGPIGLPTTKSKTANRKAVTRTAPSQARTVNRKGANK